MKIDRTSLLVVLLLTCFATLAHAEPYHAAGGVPKGAPDPAFLQWLALPAPGAQGGAPQDALGTPAPTRMACSISRDCGDGNTVSCAGTYSCGFSKRGVTCNGVETACPGYCEMSWTCTNCPSIPRRSCYSLRGDCGVTNSGCNGGNQPCICPAQPEYPPPSEPIDP